MTGPRRLIGALAIAALGASGAALVAPVSASAAPALRCGYPPAACTILFNQGSYQPGQTVRFHTTVGSFARNEAVGVTVTGPKGYVRHTSGRSGPHGGFSLNLKLADNFKPGTYGLGLTGHRDGHHLTGSFKVS